jgi:hypothetical protein
MRNGALLAFVNSSARIRCKIEESRKMRSAAES